MRNNECQISHLLKFLFEVRQLASNRQPNLGFVVKAAASHDWEERVRLGSVDNSSIVTVNEVNDSLGFLVPEEDVSTVRSGDDELGIRAEE